jgi:hypothetical protein
MNSLNYVDIERLAYIEDGIGMGDTYFRLFIKTITGQTTEAVVRVHVTNNWHRLSMEFVNADQPIQPTTSLSRRQKLFNWFKANHNPSRLS